MKTIQTLILILFIPTMAFGQFKKSFGTRAPKAVIGKVVSEVAKSSPGEIWTFPDKQILDTLPQGENLFGAERKGNVPRTILGVEPPGVVEMKIINQDQLVAICPAGFRRNNQAFNVFGSCNVYIPSKVNVILLDGKEGKLLWNTTIDASGIFNISETTDNIIVESTDYTASGNPFACKIFIFDKSTGELLFNAGEKNTTSTTYYPESGYVIKLDENPDSKDSIRLSVINTLSSNPVYQTDLTWNDLLFSPVLNDGFLIYLENNSLSRLDIESGNVLWQLPADTSLYKSQVWIENDIAYLIYYDRVTAINTGDGRMIWDYAGDMTCFESIYKADSNLFLLFKEKEEIALDKKTLKTVNEEMSLARYELRFRKGVLYPVDVERESYKFKILSLDTEGKPLWSYSNQGMIHSNLLIEDERLYFTNSNSLLGISLITGELAGEATLNLEKEQSVNILHIFEGNLVLRNEKYVQVFNPETFEKKYEHQFELAWPTISTTDINQDKKACNWILKYVFSIDQPEDLDRKSGVSVQTNIITAEIQRRQAQQVYNSVYLSTFNSAESTMSDPVMRHNYAQSSARLRSISLEYGAFMSNMISMYQTTARIKENDKIQSVLAQQMCHPFLKAELANLLKNDNEDYALRLASKTIDNQIFIAVEMFDYTSGQVSTQIISPFQFADYYGTMYTKPVYTLALNGYIPVTNLKDIVLNIAINHKDKLIYYYGPGMNMDNYTYYNKSSNKYARSRIFSVPFNFKVEE